MPRPRKYPKGFTPAQWRMLTALRDSGPASYHDMPIRFGVHWQQVWDRLEEMGEVRLVRGGHPTPYQATLCYLHKKG